MAGWLAETQHSNPVGLPAFASMPSEITARPPFVPASRLTRSDVSRRRVLQALRYGHFALAPAFPQDDLTTHRFDDHKRLPSMVGEGTDSINLPSCGEGRKAHLLTRTTWRMRASAPQAEAPNKPWYVDTAHDAIVCEFCCLCRVLHRGGVVVVVPE